MQILKLIIGILVIVTIHTSYADEQRGDWAGDWTLRKNKDELEGTFWKSIATGSKNPLKGWLQDGIIGMMYDCSAGALFLYSDDIGFAVDDIDCSPYGCDRIQYGRIKFDDNPTSKVRFYVWKTDHNGMDLLSKNKNAEHENTWIQSMKNGTEVKVEIVLFNTHVPQIATFSLNGFTDAYRWCNQ